MANYRFTRTLTNLFKSRVTIVGPIPPNFDADAAAATQLLDFKLSGGSDAPADMLAGSKYMALFDLVGSAGGSLKLEGKFVGGTSKEIGTATIPVAATKRRGATNHSHATSILFTA